MTWRTDGKLKLSTRKALRDVTNSAINAPSKKTQIKINNKNLTSLKKRKLQDHREEEEEGEEEKMVSNVGGDPLHRLLLIHSDVSSLLRQIDEVVVEAVKIKMDDDKSKEIDSFTNVLFDVKSSLKPWVLRLQKALTAPSAETEAPTLNKSEEHEVDTPEPTVPESLVSPSPLVSWRANNCVAEGGKQLFLLTPLPKPTTSTSKPLASIKAAIRVPEKCANIVESISELEFESPVKTSTSVCDLSTSLITPCIKNPPVSCALQEPYHHQLTYRKIDQFHKSTPFPVGQHKFHVLTDSDSSGGGEVSEKLGQKYPELSGIIPSCSIRNERRELEESPAWIRSPPKCCTLMEPLDEKPVKLDSLLHGCLQKVTSTFSQQMSLKENTKGNVAAVECTPLWKECESVLKTGKRPGENTLKKELWTRFEAASSTNGFELDFQETYRHKGFLDRLEEAS